MTSTDSTRWPAIPVADWHDTRDTLQLYTQIVGKVRLANEPPTNHWWNVPLYLSARGLTTSLMPHPTGPAFQIDFDFVDHRLDITTVDPTEVPAMADTCRHLDTVADVSPSSDGCEDCLRTGGQWVHLRMCMRCGHIGCCDNSPNRHATAHWHAYDDHPLIRSYEPGEGWWWCYPDELFFEVDGAPPAPSHP